MREPRGRCEFCERDTPSTAYLPQVRQLCQSYNSDLSLELPPFHSDADLSFLSIRLLGSFVSEGSSFLDWYALVEGEFDALTIPSSLEMLLSGNDEGSMDWQSLDILFLQWFLSCIDDSLYDETINMLILAFQ